MSADLDALLDRHGLSRGDLVAATYDLPREALEERWCGDWTVKDVVCHIAAWEDAAATAIEAFARGREARVPGFDGDRDAFNTRAIEAHGGLDWGKTWDWADETRKHLLSALLALYELPTASYAEGTAIRELIDQASHEEAHTRDIERWRKERGL
ncbi:MAG: hypothetical protein R3C39_01180 [Dehalococcoidia bacterium]